MRILLSNDDGILAPGLVALYPALVPFGEVFVVAPESGQSAAGHAITVSRPLITARVHVQEKFHGVSVDGRPADCVKLACREILPALPDLVVSGINAGANVGVNVIYSGTVAAAVEGAFFGIPAVAFSQQLGEEVDFAVSSELAGKVLAKLVSSGALAPGRLLNVNFPRRTKRRPRPLGIKVVRQSTAAMEDKFERRQDPRGRTYFWIATPDRPLPETEETDAVALEAGYVTITPLQFNMTHREHTAELARWNWDGVV